LASGSRKRDAIRVVPRNRTVFVHIHLGHPEIS